ncbi:hypothetical protein EJ04DRAFT_508812 [Polyplosphaeria fusca]|uniref:IgE-binding protein n=1 Tax=Polyplosphaeria fusca TaxID=682080 RepID=A0A9P4R5J9_9PLEO|nr:hypothetical protein EJ04DRAFT_508812 [Polyplosphaeria fusca]
MKTAAAFSALFASAMAQGYFGVMSTRSGSPVHLLPLTARGGKFFLGGGPPSSYCPPEVASACPNGTQTVLAGGDVSVSLGVVVPGGQQIYIAPDATMSYTTPHSAYVPEGSVRDGWTKTEGENFGNLKFEGGLSACPATKQGDGYQVFGQVEGVTLAPECLGFNALTVNATGPGAWEY